jgi:hypothetical protein
MRQVLWSNDPFATIQRKFGDMPFLCRVGILMGFCYEYKEPKYRPTPGRANPADARSLLDHALISLEGGTCCPICAVGGAGAPEMTRLAAWEALVQATGTGWGNFEEWCESPARTKEDFIEAVRTARDEHVPNWLTTQAGQG